jgi:dihydrofolate reductase
MPKITVFNNLSLDGYFTDAGGDMRWAHKQDLEWVAFTAENASGEGAMLFGRVTYQMMAAWWPTPAALAAFRVVADRMNGAPKYVLSRTLDTLSWQNSTLLKGDAVAAVRKLKNDDGPDIVMFGSGQIVALLTEAGLIDEYQLATAPIVLGAGRTLFEGLTKRIALKRTKTRSFENGTVFSCYEPAG